MTEPKFKVGNRVVFIDPSMPSYLGLTGIVNEIIPASGGLIHDQIAVTYDDGSISGALFTHRYTKLTKLHKALK